MSGDPTLRRARNMTWQNSQYEAIASHISLAESSVESRVDFFRNTPADELINKIPPAGHWSAAIDGTFVRYDITIGILSDPNDNRGKPDWCEQIFVGDAEHDATCLHARVMSLPPTELMKRLHGGLESTLSISQSEKVLTDYSLTPMYQNPRIQSAEPHSQFYDSVLELASDLRFHLPKVKLAEGFANRRLTGSGLAKKETKWTKCWRYEYHQSLQERQLTLRFKPNPILGSNFSNYAGHEQELAFLLQNFPALSSFSHSGHSPPHEIQEKTAEFGKNMAAVWIGFAHGEGIHSPGNRNQKEQTDDKVLVMGPNYEFKFVAKDEYNREYRKGRVEKLWEHIPWQRWFELGEKLQGC
ncbi:uncharacterized protein BP5553_10527 [Venustampulla echinocandica]|uniref:Uncharacterized protein n=1 Tax=Venustampulla echinocandica TaxID=2656787 RepID=A0A370T8T4_9HELO|nr:uncharacterized protein BP5553_10527 [Venustampulla echinocandica]RDL29900.1 hypothetical protein BP5553_10527 [Venustampulla echinocandica]